MHNFLEKLAVIITAPFVFIGSLFAPTHVESPIATPVHEVAQYEEPLTLGAALPQATGVFETSLAAPISSSATSMTLTSNTVRGGGSVSGYTCFTVDEGTAQAEVMCGTVDATAVTSMTRGISYADGITSVAGNKFAHRRGANVKITDFPLVQILKAQNNGDETFPNVLSYETGVSPVGSSDLVDKEYVLSVVNGGDVSFEKIVAAGTAGETVAAGDLVYLKAADGYWWKTDADTAATLYNVQLGIAQGEGANGGEEITGGVLLSGVDATLTGTAGSLVYASNTAGGVSTSTGTNERVIGQYLPSSGGLYFDPNFYNSAAIGGSTFGTPSASNKFITQDYLSSATGLPVVRVYTSNDTWSKPAGLKYAVVEVVGGGGGGGDRTGNSSSDNAGGGASAGGYSKKLIVASSLGSSETVTVGAGGTKGSNGAGNNGGNSSFGSHLSANGGVGGEYNGGNGYVAGGTATGGDINIPGGYGSQGLAIDSDGDRTLGGLGGSSVLGNGNSTGYGSGGKGSDRSTNNSQNGASGVVIVIEYYS